MTSSRIGYQPERLAGKEYSIRSDVWSSGITLLELVENRYPFPPDLSAIELMMQITQSEVSITYRSVIACQLVFRNL
jgi:serine/threonine protein kinase